MSKKDNKINLIHFKNIKWYRQGLAAKLFYVSFPLSACGNFYLKNKPLNIYYRDIILDIKDDFMNDWLSVNNLIKVANFYIKKQKSNKNFIKSARNFWLIKNLKNFVNKVKYLENQDLKKYSDKKLILNFESFSKCYLRLWQNAIFHDAFDYYSDQFLNNFFRKNNLINSKSDLNSLFNHNYKTIFKKEKTKFNNLVNLSKKIYPLNKSINQGIQLDNLKDKYPHFYRLLQNHQHEFDWLHNDYSSIVSLPLSYFYKRLIQERLHKIKHQNKKLKINKKSELYKIADFLNIISAWRDDRKAANQIAGKILKRFANELSRRCNISLSVIEYLDWREYSKAFNFQKKEWLEIKKRKVNGIIYYIQKKDNLIIIKDGLRIRLLKSLNKKFSNQNIFTGLPISLGIAVGEIKIIKDKRDFYKLKKGEILVAPNTRPEYVPLMRKAGAVITEEGGVTSHAAIVSRELGKPAVVGVQGILDIIKDGDKVEVDANKGIIKIDEKR